MRGLIWSAGVWIVALSVAHTVHRRTGRLPSLAITRERLALVLLLIAINAIAGRTSADEVLANPVVAERAARGALAGLAAVLVLPTLIGRIRTATVRPLPGFTALTIYLAVAATSVLYSAAPIVTIGKAFELSVAVAIVATAVLAVDPTTELRGMIELVLFLEGVLLAVAVAGFFVAPQLFAAPLPRPGFVFRDTMVSPFAHPNVMAAMGGVVAAYGLVAALEAPSRVARRWWFGAFAYATVGIVLASGRQGVVIWLASSTVVLFLYRRAIFVAVVVPLSAYLVTTYADVLWRAFNRNATYHLSTLTGRVNWWQAALHEWSKHPWTGYGFGAGGRFVALTSARGRPSNVHSGYIEGLVGVGLLGMVPLAFATLRTAVWATRSLVRKVDARFAILLLPLALHTAIDLGFGAWLKPDFVILACLIGLADLTRLGGNPGPVPGSRGDPRSPTVPLPV